MSFLHRLDRYLAVAEHTAVILLLSSLLGLGLLQILLRNVFASGLFWADALLRHLVLWLAFVGASLATRERRHLSMQMLGTTLPAWGQSCLAVLTDLAALIVCVLLVHAAWKFVLFERQGGIELAFGLPAWLAQSMIPLGFLGITVRLILHILEALQRLVHQKSEP